MRRIDNFDLDCLIPIEEFVEGVMCGMFTDDDGFGYFASATHYDDSLRIQPSDLNTPTWDEGSIQAEYILWFNK